MKRRGGWREEGPDQQAVPTNSPPLHRASQDMSGAEALQAAEPHMHFRPAPAGFPQLKAGDRLWEDWEHRSQLQGIRDMMGEGPMFSGIDPPEIQRGSSLLRLPGLMRPCWTK